MEQELSMMKMISMGREMLSGAPSTDPHVSPPPVIVV
jgi:hypothetical protein